ncbi:hypothetical protein NE237_019968 [Protea cynaroides]|uniref:Uncharacterized protein n=1 Tax=Protea cynaroides TaxID=273540 RepID=A0A9Q0H5R0_9MAGN|nr:hypothetical protein NE237_019968 [Protea cynaroides]
MEKLWKKRVFSVIPVVVLVLVVLLRCEGADHGSSYYSSPACNSTIAACIADDVEFLMEFHLTRRILTGEPSSVYDALIPDKIPPGDRYADSLPNLNGKKTPGRCEVYNKCQKNLSG